MTWTASSGFTYSNAHTPTGWAALKDDTFLLRLGEPVSRADCCHYHRTLEAALECEAHSNPNSMEPIVIRGLKRIGKKLTIVASFMPSDKAQPQRMDPRECHQFGMIWANCLNCRGLRWDGQGSYTAAQRHHRATGHEVVVHETTETRFARQDR